MLTKTQRHQRITRLIQEHEIWSQQELQELLAKSGIEVTQATLSRDLTSLGLFKGPTGYVMPAQAAIAAAAPGDSAEALLQRTLRREVRSLEVGGSLVIIRTDPGHANVLAVEIDRARPHEVLGSIAGDDTIFLATRGTSSAARLAKRFRLLIDVR